MRKKIRERQHGKQPIETTYCTKMMPHDVTTETLLRLPVKSLLRFKSVSKRGKPWVHKFSRPS